MSPKRNPWRVTLRCLLAIVCAIVIAPGDTWALQSSGAGNAAPAQDQQPKIPADQLDSLVAPIALYPDPLLAQVLAASTYPLELIQLHSSGWQEIPE